MSGERLAGKAAIVTGAGQSPGPTLGNGRAIAERFAAEGASVVCVDRVIARAEETVAGVVAGGGVAVAIEADVTDPAACGRVADEALAAFGRVEILVNNVGIGGGGDGPIHRVSDEAFDRIMTVNLKGAVLMTEAVLPAMREQHGGSIVNISSLASVAGATQVAYELSKAAMNRLTTSVAQSQAKHLVRCNAVLPGLMDTPMAVDGIAAATGRPRDEVKAERDAQVPLGRRMGTAEDTANATLFLASDEARYVTGVLLPVAGGLAL